MLIDLCMLDYCNFELPIVDEKVSPKGKIELYFDDSFMYTFVSLYVLNSESCI